jgi:hypothetical protein
VPGRCWGAPEPGQGSGRQAAPLASAAYGWVVAITPSGPIRLVGGDTDYGYTSDLRILPRYSLATVALLYSTAVPAAEIGHELQAAYAG